MYSFGKRAPRLLAGFGIAGLLGDECRIFYEGIFSTRHIGRISDLLAARLAQAGPNELRLRSLILFGAFQGYLSQQAKAGLSDPMIIECGIDEEKIAVGVSFLPMDSSQVSPEGLIERVQGRSPANAFEGMLVELLDQADRLVIRHQADGRRVEVVSLLGLREKMPATAFENGPSVHYVEVVSGGETGQAEPPKAAEYVALADLDYGTLLKSDHPPSEAPKDRHLETRVAGLDEGTELADAIRARGAPALDDGETVISGTTQHVNEEVIHVQGTREDIRDTGTVRISGSQAQDESEKTIVQLQHRILELESEKVSGSRSRSIDEEVGLVPPSSDAASSSAPSSMMGLLKKIWPFGRSKEKEGIEIAEAAPLETVLDKTASQAPIQAAAAAAPQEGTEDVANHLMTEIQTGGLEQAISKIQLQSVEIKKELESAKAKKWVDELVVELGTERRRLQDLAKKLNSSIKQKEFQFKSKEVLLQEELHRRDEMIKNKSALLGRTKDQLAQVQMNMERLKATATASSAEDVGVKHKFAQTQRLLMLAKEENAQMVARMNEMKSKLASAQLSQRSSGASAAEMTELQSKFDRVQRQAEDLKKANQQLMDRLAEASKPKAASAVPEDFKKRLDSAVRTSQLHKKEAEKLKSKVEELSREELRLKMEVNRSQAELKTLKQTIARNSQSSSGDGNAAA